MRFSNFWGASMLVRVVPSALVAAMLMAAPVLAQTQPKLPPKAQPQAQPKAPGTAQAPAAPGIPVQSVPSPAKAPEPAVDEGTAQRMAAALLSYSAIEVRGGWPVVPASAKLAPGASAPEVAVLRERLVISDDLAPEYIRGETYDATVAAAVRRFQARHGLEETGTIGPKTLAALNVPVGKRVRQLAASLDRLSAMDFQFGQRYVVVNLPAAFAEAVVGDKVVRRHVVQVGRPDRPSPTLTTFITTVNLNPTWTVPLGILKKD